MTTQRSGQHLPQPAPDHDIVTGFHHPRAHYDRVFI